VAVVYWPLKALVVAGSTTTFPPASNQSYVRWIPVSRIIRRQFCTFQTLIAHRGTLLTGFVFLLSIFTIPLRAQVVDGATPIQAGVRLLPLLIATAVGSVIGGAASSKTKLISWSLMAASAFMILGTGLLSSLPADGSFSNAQYGYEVILGVGLGITMSAVTVLTSITVQPRDHGKSLLKPPLSSIRTNKTFL
jgi:hypothetical protein